MAGIVGNCMMKCAGDSGEYCGGAQLISLYKKCDGACQNAQVGVVGNFTSTPESPSTAQDVNTAPTQSQSGSTGTGSGPSSTAKDVKTDPAQYQSGSTGTASEPSSTNKVDKSGPTQSPSGSEDTDKDIDSSSPHKRHHHHHQHDARR